MSNIDRRKKRDCDTETERLNAVKDEKKAIKGDTTLIQKYVENRVMRHVDTSQAITDTAKGTISLNRHITYPHTVIGNTEIE